MAQIQIGNRKIVNKKIKLSFTNEAIKIEAKLQAECLTITHITQLQQVSDERVCGHEIIKKCMAMRNYICVIFYLQTQIAPADSLHI